MTFSVVSFVLIVGSCLLMSHLAIASESIKFHFGAELAPVKTSKLMIDLQTDDSVEFSSMPPSKGLFVGVCWVENFCTEYEYRYFGSYKSTTLKNNNYGLKIVQQGIYANLSLPVWRISLFGRAGVGRLDFKERKNQYLSKNYSSAVMFGYGISYTTKRKIFFRIGVSAYFFSTSYKNLNFNSDEISNHQLTVAGIAMAYRF